MEEEGEDQENEKDDGREDGQQGVEGRIAESQNNHIMSRLQQIAISCKRSDYNQFFETKNLAKVSL